MRASKESARVAFQHFVRVRDAMPEKLRTTTWAMDICAITDFIQAAEKRLPTEEAIERDRKRRSRQKVGG